MAHNAGDPRPQPSEAGYLSVPRRGKNRRRRTIGHDRYAEILAVLLLNARDVDDADLGVRRAGVDRGKIQGRIDAIDFPFEFLIEAVDRPIRSSWSVDASVGASRGARNTTRVRSVTRLRDAAGAGSDDPENTSASLGRCGAT